MISICAYSDSLHFFRSWLANPLRVASVTPSSRSLARLITREVGARHAPVLELGPGTGVFTRALIERGLREEDLVLVESGPEFASVLRQRFPTATILTIDAARLGDSLPQTPSGIGAAVSGLPLLSMPPRKVMAILAGVFLAMRPGGSLYQFTYGPRCPIPRPVLDRLGLRAIRLGGTFRNFPPASVYRISRRQPLSLAQAFAIRG
ncbi:rRNA adenine N-6-methyltransferase family protein [Ensifer adhaerens]|uniref:class I SAM-dependent methyltransferase n=1 Tax=Ensifer adhaerens TaxID=106592 RepID=UPI0023A99C47|nr:rRNA adenine N-6-methyltransferase family protein [Ensifer adhaerens]WDZ75207.1 rRNA adenine N-6-methyltransferase family protein [Ensifer adhaerens]